jgi:hypothetical protein
MLGRRVLALELDLRNESTIRDMAPRAIEHFGTVDILVTSTCVVWTYARLQRGIDRQERPGCATRGTSSNRDRWNSVTNGLRTEPGAMLLNGFNRTPFAGRLIACRPADLLHLIKRTPPRIPLKPSSLPHCPGMSQAGCC